MKLEGLKIRATQSDKISFVKATGSGLLPVVSGENLPTVVQRGTSNMVMGTQSYHKWSEPTEIETIL